MKTKRDIESISRRGFLKKLGGVGLSSSLLKLSMLSSNMLWARSVFAAGAPKRMIFVYIAGGAIPDEWFPRQTGTNFTLPSMSSPLEPFKDYCIFPRGIYLDAPGHVNISKALGWGPDTLDVFLAKKFGQETPFSHLQLGVISNGHGSTSRQSWREPEFEDNPLNAFRRLFGSVAPTTVNLEQRQKLSVLDSSLESLNQFRNRLGGFERARLDEHAEAIQRIESRLNSMQSPGTGECSAPVFNQEGFNGDVTRDVNFDAIADLQSDIATLALKCDLSRVISINLGNTSCELTIPETGVPYSLHACHHGAPLEGYIKFRRYLTTKLAYLVNNLANTRDMDGNSLLDNTVLLTSAEFSDGRSHEGNDMPYTLIGRGGGALTTGRSIALNNVKHSTLLDTLAQGVGVDVNAPDYPRFGSGPISGILN